MTIQELRDKQDAPVVLADQRGIITYVNKQFERLFGWQAKEIVGRPLTAIMPQAYRDQHHLGFTRFLATEKPTLLNKPLSLKAMKKDGGIFTAEHQITAEKENDRWVFGATIRPL